MRQLGLALALAASVPLSRVRPDRGNMPTSSSRRRRAIIKLLVMRPDVTVELGDDRRHGRAARRLDRAGPRQHHRTRCAAQQAGRGGKVLILERRNELPGVSAEDGRRARAAALRGRQFDRAAQISRARICRPSAARASTRRSARTRSRSAAGPATTMPCSSTPRTASPRPAASRCRCSASPAASSASARPTSAAAASSPMPRWSTSGPARWSGSTSSRPAARSPGSSSATSARPQGAAQMVDRLLGRMKPGREVRQRRWRSADVHALLEISRRSLLAGGGVAAASLTTGVAQARIRPADMVPLIGPGFRADRPGREGHVAADGAGRGGGLRLQPADQGSRS